MSWVLEKTLESPLDCKEIKPVNPKGNQSWIFTGRTDGEAETPILWLPDAKNWLIGKDPDAGKDWRQEEKGATEDEMVGWPHRLDGCEFEQAPGVGVGQGSLLCCSLRGHKEPDTTERLNWTEAPLSMGFPRQEYGSRLPFPSPGDLPDPGMQPAFPALAGRFFVTEPPRKPKFIIKRMLKFSWKLVKNKYGLLFLFFLSKFMKPLNSPLI